MKINGNEIKAKKFAYDGCHKIYILETAENEKVAKEYGYDIYDISLIKETYENSCPLKFIDNWNLDKQYVKQGEKAIFENMKYKIEIEEVLEKVVEVEANSLDEAIDKVKEAYRNEEIILNEDNFMGTEFSEYKE